MNKGLPTILTVGASPDVSNPNAVLRTIVRDAFAALLPAENVRDSVFEKGPEMVEDFKPDLVVVFGSCAPAVCEYSSLRAAIDAVGGHCAFWVHEDPCEFDYNFKIVKMADTIFTNDRATLAYYERNRIFHLPMAASKEIHFRPVTSSKKYDIFFCGIAFPNRVQVFRGIERVLEEYQTYICGLRWPAEQSSIYHNKRISYHDLPNLYSQSKIVLNVGREFDLANTRGIKAITPPPRTFEAAMAGALQLCFSGTHRFEEFFREGEEIIVLKSVAELKEKLEYLFNNPDLNKEIARRAQARALAEHTYLHRVRVILDTCLPDWNADRDFAVADR